MSIDDVCEPICGWQKENLIDMNTEILLQYYAMYIHVHM